MVREGDRRKGVHCIIEINEYILYRKGNGWG